MKVKSKTSTTDSTNRLSALQRLSKPTSMNSSIHQRLSAPTNPIVTDARQLLTNRNKPVFDARQLLSRQSSKTMTNSLIIRKDIEPEEDNDNQQTVVLTRLNNGRLTSETSDRSVDKRKNTFVSTEPISFTKTIPNTSYDGPSQNAKSQSSSTDQKVVISFVNDQCRKRPRSPSAPPIIKRLNDAAIQTKHTSSSSSRLTKRRESTDSPKKQPSFSSKSSLKQTSTSTRSKQTSNPATILITNLQSSVTEDDVIELFGEIGDINEIKTLSHGCIQLTYSKLEDAEQAVEKYHNRLLDGQLMYVSLQQPSSYSKKSSSDTTNELVQSNSNKISIDPSFFRQALFNPSNNTTNPVQFQVKL